MEGVQIHHFLLNFLCEEIQAHNVTSQGTDFGQNNFALVCQKYPTLGTCSVKTKTPIDKRCIKSGILWRTTLLEKFKKVIWLDASTLDTKYGINKTENRFQFDIIFARNKNHENMLEMVILYFNCGKYVLTYQTFSCALRSCNE